MGTEINFKCPETGEEFFIAKYTIGFVDAKVYRDEQMKELVNPANGVPLIPIEKEGEFNANVGRFSGMSITDKHRTMKKRSVDHNKEQKDRFHSINRDEKQ